MTWASHRRFWFAHDEGTLAQAALRILDGQVPHRDFSHPYTGADAVVHALWFKIFGVSLGSIRTGFAILVSAWLIAIALWIYTRTASRWAAVGVLALAVFGPAMYPAAIPSWYVTMLVCGAVAVLSVGDTPPSRRALLCAGLMIGVAAAFKVTALYALGGVVLWLVGTGESSRGRLWAILVLCAAAVGIVGVLGPAAGLREWCFVGAPAVLALIWAAASEIRRVREGGVEAGWGSTWNVIALCCGFAIGVGPLLAWLGATGALAPFLDSLNGVGDARVVFARFSPPQLHTLWWAVLLVAVVLVAYARRQPHVVTTSAVLLLLFVLTWTDAAWHQAFWRALRGAIPLGMAVAVGIGIRHRTTVWMPAGLCVLAMMSLSQFPFASPIYFVYLVPLAVLAVLTLPVPSATGQRTLGMLALAAVGIGALQVLPAPPNAIGIARITPPSLEVLAGSRGGLRVSPEDAAVFRQLETLLHDSVPAGPIWAGPDSPEVAFLSARQDLNRDPFSFLAGERRAEEGILRPEVMAVVVRPHPPFSPPLPQLLLQDIRARFAHRVVIGPFVVFWGRLS